jgi:hypothetical protein
VALRVTGLILVVLTLAALGVSAILTPRDSSRARALTAVGWSKAAALDTRFECGMVIETGWGEHSDPRGPATLRELKALGVDAVQVVPFAFQPDVERPELRFRDHTVTQTAFIREAHSLGLVVQLKPHIWSNQFWGPQGRWRGDLRMHSESDWLRWFAHYREFILHYARIAEATQVEALCIGLEYVQATRERPEDWRALIAATRAVYHGPLTYAANLHGEAEEISFWDELDYIGVNVYPSLTSVPGAPVETLVQGYAPTVATLARLAERHRRPVIVTEIGFPATPDAAIRPWEWPGRDDEVDLAAQSRAYEATFQAFWGKPWLKGIYWWKWPIHGLGGGPGDPEYTPRNKPAERVMARYFRDGGAG